MLCAGRAFLTHPSFGNQGEQEAAQLDESLSVRDGALYQQLAEQVTPFVCNLDEATVNCGCVEPVGPNPFRRLRASSQQTGFTWRDCRQEFEAAMVMENRQERLVALADASAAERRLQQRLLAARVEAVAFKNRSAPSAQFEALSLGLWGTPVYHALLRSTAVEEMRRHPKEYRCFLGSGWEAYSRAMAKQSTPGDELTARAIGDHFGMAVSFVTADPWMWVQRYAPRQTRTAREAFVAFLGPNTWMPIRRQSGFTTLRLSFTGAGGELKAVRDQQRQRRPTDFAAGSVSGGSPPRAPHTP